MNRADSELARGMGRMNLRDERDGQALEKEEREQGNARDHAEEE